MAHDLVNGFTHREERSAGASAPPSLDAAVTHLQTSTSGTLACYRDERGEGAPVLLLHSVNAAASAYEMKPLFEHYRGRRPVFALDLPGFGASSREAAEYNVERFVSAIERVLIDVVGADRTPAVVVSLSLTSEFAARAALRSPELFRGLVHLSPTGLGAKPHDGGLLESIGRRVLRNDAVAGGLLKVLATRPSVRYFLHKSFVGPVPEDLLDRASVAARAPGAHHAPAAFLAGSLFTPNARGELYAKVSPPQLVVHDKDPYTDFGGVPSLLTANPNAFESVLVPSRGMAHWEHTGRVVDAIESFESSVTQR